MKVLRSVEPCDHALGKSTTSLLRSGIRTYISFGDEGGDSRFQAEATAGLSIAGALFNLAVETRPALKLAN